MAATWSLTLKIKLSNSGTWGDFPAQTHKRCSDPSVTWTHSCSQSLTHQTGVAACLVEGRKCCESHEYYFSGAILNGHEIKETEMGREQGLYLPLPPPFHNVSFLVSSSELVQHGTRGCQYRFRFLPRLHYSDYMHYTVWKLKGAFFVPRPPNVQ